MPNLLLFLLLITVSILIIIASVSVRFVYYNELIIKFNFLLFSIILYPNRRIKKRKRTNNQKKAKRRSLRISSFKKGFDYLLKRSTVRIDRIDLKLVEPDPARFVLQEKNISTLIYIFLTYLSIKANSILTEDTHFISYRQDCSNTHIDITLTSTLFHVATALFMFLKPNSEKKRKRARKFVRKQNE